MLNQFLKQKMWRFNFWVWCKHVSIVLPNGQMLKTTHLFYEWTCFLCYWMIKQHGLSRERLLLYVQSHIGLHPPVVSTLTDLFIRFLLNKRKKSGLKMKLGGEGCYLGFVWCHRYTPFLPGISKLFIFHMFLLILFGFTRFFIPFSFCHAVLTQQC